MRNLKSIQPIIVPPGGGTALNILGSTNTIKVSGEQTNGAFSVAEVLAPPQSSVPPHIHTREDETFYVLEGSAEVQCGDRTFTVTPGTVLVLPRNLPHAFRNPGNTPVRILFTMTPAGFEGFFEEVSRLPSDQPPDPKKLAAIGRKYGLEFVPPNQGQG
jgi:mannose-6-phosphate isomerase-like protein (cupin superfamily)